MVTQVRHLLYQTDANGMNFLMHSVTARNCLEARQGGERKGQRLLLPLYAQKRHSRAEHHAFLAESRNNIISPLFSEQY